jgi:cell division protein FtsB
MADLWTSQSELVSRILVDLKSNDDAHSAMADALHRKHKVVEQACIGLQKKYEESKAENQVLKARVQELEAALKAAEREAWGAVVLPPKT